MEIQEIKLGDAIPAGPFLGNLTDEQVMLQATKVELGSLGKVVTFEATFFGVYLGRAIAMESGQGSVVWSWGHGK